MRRRALFIDIDGVLHPSPEPGSRGPSISYMEVGPLGWLPCLVQALHGYDDVEIVVHSSWREVYSAEELSEMLSELGERRISLAPQSSRHPAIEAWLGAQGQPIDFLVLDDEAGEFPSPAPSWLVVCDPKLGTSDPVVLARLRLWLAM